MDDITEPPPPNIGDAIPFIGETKTYEFILDIAAGGDIVLNVGGTWFGRRASDATNEEALRYLKSKAFRMGQEMRQIQLGLPGVVGGGTVTVTTTPPVTVGPVPTTPLTHNPNGNKQTEINVEQSDNAGEYPENDSPTPTAIVHETKSKRTEEPAIGINLSGCFETWGISSGQSIEIARIEFSGLTAQQIKQILQRIPSTFKASLDITYVDGGQQ